MLDFCFVKGLKFRCVAKEENENRDRKIKQLCKGRRFTEQSGKMVK